MEYPVNKGAGNPVEFKGLKSQYLFVFAGGLVARMAFLRQQLHKTVFAVAGVQPEHRPCQQTAGYGPERDAYPLVHACQVKDDHRQESFQIICKKKKTTIMRNVLKAETLERKFPLLSVENGCIVSKDADLTVAF